VRTYIKQALLFTHADIASFAVFNKLLRYITLNHVHNKSKFHNL